MGEVVEEDRHTHTHSHSPACSEADIQVTRSLLSSLYGFGQQPEDDPKLAKLLKHTEHLLRDDQTITSWKMQDYAYKRDPCPYPTRARGLFTAGTQRIVARAYDKFFNVDEVSWTKASLNRYPVSCAPIASLLSSLAILFAVGKSTRPDGCSVLPHPEVKWVSHPHCRTLSYRAPRHLQARYRNGKRARHRLPRTDGRTLAGQAYQKVRQDARGSGYQAVERELDPGSRGERSLQRCKAPYLARL